MLSAVAPPNGTCWSVAAETRYEFPALRCSLLAAAAVLTSFPWLRSDHAAAEPAVDSGVQGRNACGETPSTLALRPLTVTFPPSTGSTARTPLSLAILVSCAEVIPPGTAAIRSGTYNCLGAAVAAGAREPDACDEAAAEMCEAPPRAPGVMTLKAAGAAKAAVPARLRLAAAVARALGPGRDGNLIGRTMYKTI